MKFLKKFENFESKNDQLDLENEDKCPHCDCVGCECVDGECVSDEISEKKKSPFTKMDRKKDDKGKDDKKKDQKKPTKSGKLSAKQMKLPKGLRDAIARGVRD